MSPLAAWAQAAPAAPAPAPAASAAASAAAPAGAASAPARPPSPPAAAAPTPAPQRIEITGGRESDTDQRRLSTASKIVIGREEIERFGDSSVSEVLKRLPGVTTPGAPGRGGPPRMRGLGGGYTQILVDGQRAPAGFSLDQLTPEQLERIEIFRAPTAETGARAIGGTINIVTREGFKARLNDVRMGSSFEHGKATPGLFWTHNNSKDNFIYNLTAAVFSPHGVNKTAFDTTFEDSSKPDVAPEHESQRNEQQFSRLGMNVNARLQWRGEGGDMFMLMPGGFAMKGDTRSTTVITLAEHNPKPIYNNAHFEQEFETATLRLNTQWRTRLPAGFRLELNGNGNLTRGNNHSLRSELMDSTLVRTEAITANNRERSLNLNGKLSRALGDDGQHSFVSGWELEGLRRDETRTTINQYTGQEAVHQGSDEDDNLHASSTRLAIYAQDEWTINPNWSMHAGLRAETITTVGDAQGGSNPRNRSQVTTPLVHFLYKPDPKKRDQVRISLTRSYKSPTLQNLVARYSYSSRFPIRDAAGQPQTNEAAFPDRTGNPNLRPELASGIDVAFERYLPEGGVLSANLFARRITDYIRSELSQQVESSTGIARWVARPTNIGDAVTTGIELEAKFRLDQMISEAPRVEVRSNLSLFRSKVDGIAGPDNRLDQQPKGTLNLGADYRFRGTPLTLGASYNYTPGYRTQVSDIQAVTAPPRRQLDAFALWVFNPAAQLRLNLSNLLAQDYATSNTLTTSPTNSERQLTTNQSFLNVRLGLELKL